MTAPLDAIFTRSLSPYLKAIRRVMRAQAALSGAAAGSGTAGDPGEHQSALDALAALIAATQGTADLLGREAAWNYAATRQGADALQGFALPLASSAPQNVLPSATFDEAVADILARAPRVVRDAAERAGEEVARIYSTEHAIAFAQSASIEITKKVQSIIAKALAEGLPLPSAEALIRKSTDWTHAYAQTAYRTNVSNAYTAGRFRQMQDPDIARVIGALRYGAVLDANTRPNHAAADGMIAVPGDPVWAQMSPPAGFNCRCVVEFIDWITLQRMGLADGNGNVKPGRLPPGAFTDPGFRHGGRPDLAVYGGAA